MIDAAKAATAYLPPIITLRIIYHKPPSLDLFSHDVVSDRIVELPEGIDWTDADWDDDGHTDVDLGEESNDDFEDSDSESSSSSDLDESAWLSLREEADPLGVQFS